MTGMSDRRADIQEFLDTLPENGGFEILFLNAEDFGKRAGETSLFYVIKKNASLAKGVQRVHLKGLVPKVNMPFILALIAGDSIEQVAREAISGKA